MTPKTAEFEDRPAARGSQLRRRLVVAFLSVSVVPVLAASFIAALWISSQFDDRLQIWLESAARSFAQSIGADRDEAARAAGILAASFTEKIGEGENAPIAFSANLLGSVGYDFVAIYAEDGAITYRYGAFDQTDWLPKSETPSYFLISSDGKPALVMGGARRFVSGGKAYFAFVADRTNDEALELAGPDASLHIDLLSLRAGDPGGLIMEGGPTLTRRQREFALAQLAAGHDSFSLLDRKGLALGFASFRDAQGVLIGLVVSRLADEVAYPAMIRTIPLFLLLSLVAGALSLAVALVLSKRIARPIRALTRGVRDIAAGDYEARVPEEGGREIAGLAGGFNAMAANLDRLHRLEGAMRRREQFAALGEAAAVIAHEIRNPLGIIKTSSQVIRMKAAAADGSDRLLGFILEEVDRIDRLVQDLLDYVRPNEPENEPLDLHRDVALRVLEIAAPELDRRGVTQAVVGPGVDLPILGDRRSLHGAVLNIVLNAMDAMPDGGRLTLLARRQDDEAVIEIEDSGSGVPDDVAARIFEPFVTSKPRGTGLGLAKVRSVVEQHGGRVAVRSVEGEGATFTLSFPIRREDRP